MSLEDIVIVENLEKSIKGKKIIHDLSFKVQKGQIYGFLGPNGSGKTTTIRMLTGMIKQSSGSIKIMGYDIQKDFKKVMQNLSAIVENPALFDYMSGWDNLMQVVRRLDKKVELDHLKWCVQTVELTDRIHENVKNYSLGMKQRLAIAQALVSSPQIIILDEPTNGMDPSGIKDMRSLIKKLSREQQITIFLSSHLLSEIEQLCDHVLIINKGRQVVAGSVSDLIARNTSTYSLEVDPFQVDVAYKKLKNNSMEVYKENNKIIVNCKKEDIPHMVNFLYEKNIHVYLINQQDNSLEDYFLSVTQEVM
ncbi:ABC transporter ATP-binding protein [Niallia nealsonii]|uniref:ABC transporter ATP-binding protein n=1 Tax=Niallia nealsonii TaxID=115979 RepID=A0A2N0Z5M1_9BACI|nr:ABC transporter ATP-binding protein [Niallia nealsonii]PKG24784.1 ABC transporter ATP-binding protein [Niallia nealsonii]